MGKKTSNRSELTNGVFFNGSEIEIIGVFKSPNTGHHVEIVSSEDNAVPRQSVSIWALTFQDGPTAEKIFNKYFGISRRQAQIKDQLKIKKEIALKTVIGVSAQEALVLH